MKSQYGIIKGLNIEVLVSLVNEQIQRGWEPVGGVSIEVYPNHPPTFYQAMIYKDRVTSMSSPK